MTTGKFQKVNFLVYFARGFNIGSFIMKRGWKILDYQILLCTSFVSFQNSFLWRRT